MLMVFMVVSAIQDTVETEKSTAQVHCFFIVYMGSWISQSCLSCGRQFFIFLWRRFSGSERKKEKGRIQGKKVSFV